MDRMPTVAEMGRRVAQPGGFMGPRNRSPAVKTLRRGLEKLMQMLRVLPLVEKLSRSSKQLERLSQAQSTAGE